MNNNFQPIKKQRQADQDLSDTYCRKLAKRDKLLARKQERNIKRFSQYGDQ